MFHQKNAHLYLHLVRQHQLELALTNAIAIHDDARRFAIVLAIESLQQILHHVFGIGNVLKATFLDADSGDKLARDGVERADNGRNRWTGKLAGGRVGDVGAEDNDRLGHDWRADTGRDGDVLTAAFGVDLI